MQSIKLIAGTAIVCILVFSVLYSKILKPGIVVDVCAQEAAQITVTNNERGDYNEPKSLERTQRCINSYLGK